MQTGSTRHAELKIPNILVFAHENTHNLMAIEEALAKIISDKNRHHLEGTFKAENGRYFSNSALFLAEGGGRGVCFQSWVIDHLTQQFFT